MLILPPWYFADESNNYTGTPSTPYGTTITLGANNADGSAVEILAALTHDVHWLVINFITNQSTGGTHASQMLHILADPAGGASWAEIISGLLVSANKSASGDSRAITGYAFPVYIKAGTSLGAYGRTSHTATKEIRVSISVMGNPSRPDQWWCGSKVESVGTTPVSARGTTVTPGTGAYGSWTSIGSTTSYNYGYIQPGYGGEASASMGAQSNLLQIGYGDTKLPGSPTWYLGGVNYEVGSVDRHSMPVWCDIPAGTQMQARAWRSIATDTLEISLYGVS